MSKKVNRKIFFDYLCRCDSCIDTLTKGCIDRRKERMKKINPTILNREYSPYIITIFYCEYGISHIERLLKQ